MTLSEKYEKETGMAAQHLGVYYPHYVQWLEAKVSQQQDDFNPQAIAAFNRMLANEQCGGTGWWSGWESLKTALWKLQP